MIANLSWEIIVRLVQLVVGDEHEAVPGDEGVGVVARRVLRYRQPSRVRRDDMPTSSSNWISWRVKSSKMKSMASLVSHVQAEGRSRASTTALSTSHMSTARKPRNILRYAAV